MARVSSYQKYINLGEWKCSDSPTGAHHWQEVKKERQYGYFLCKYCFGVKKFPNTLDAALKESGKTLKSGRIVPQYDLPFKEDSRYGGKIPKGI